MRSHKCGVLVPLLGVTVLALAAARAHAQVPATGEFRANAYTPAAQGAPVVAREPDGDFVMAWQSEAQDGDGYGVFGQRYDASGAPRGAEFQVNTYTTGDQTRPWLALDGSGRFVVVWNTVNATPDGDGGSVHGQRFAADGSQLGTEFIVNTYTTGDQYWARVAVNRAGTFVVAWQSAQDGSGTSIQAQRFDRDGQRLLGEFQVNLATAGDQVTPDVKINNLGRMGVVWAGPDGSGSGIYARAFNEFGAPVGQEVLANTVTAGIQALPSLHGARTGDPDDFPSVVAWESFGQDGSDYGVFARQFRGFGAPVGPEFQVNTYTTGAQGGLPLAAMDEGGNFVIAWRSAAPQDGSGDAIVARRFASSGQPRSPEFVVNAYTTGSQDQAHVAVDPFGNFVVAWRSAGQDGSVSGAFAQRFQGLHPRALEVDPGGNHVLDPGETVDVKPSWQNLNGLAQTFGGNLVLLGGPCAQSVTDPVADYGSVPNGVTVRCTDCYAVSAGSRCTQHWDFATLETLVPDIQGQARRWVFHVGESFADVPGTSPYHRFIETLFHHLITGGCGATDYCPSLSTTREQMAVFVLLAKEGSGYAPPFCGATPMFADVPVSSPFCRWIEELARRGVVSGCGGGNYCPTAPVTREQLAVFVLRALDPTLIPPACTTPVFNDVPASSPFCRWIEELARRGVVAGCGGGNYCPTAAVTREQMSVFLAVTFGLSLYGV